MAGRRRGLLGRRWVRVLLAVALALVLLRIALPYGIELYANRLLRRTEDYRGRIEDVDLTLVRGAYRIRGITVEGREGAVSVSRLVIPEVELSVQWSALLEGALVGEVVIREPEIVLVAVPEPEVEPVAHWTETIESLFPIRLDRTEVQRGTLRYVDREAEPPVDVAITDFHLVARDFTNRPAQPGERPGTVEARAVAFGSGELEADAKVDPIARLPDFSLAVRAEHVDLTEINDYLRAYVGVDVERGWLALYLEAEAEGGSFRGSVKPLVEGLDVLRAEELDEQGPFATAWEALAGATAEALESQPEDRQAAKVPFQGHFENPEIGIVAAVESVLSNAFVNAIEPGFADMLGIEPEVEAATQEAREEP